MSRKTKPTAVASAKPRRVLAPKPANSHDDEEAKLREEIRKLSLSNEELLRLAEKSPPPPEFFEGEVEKPW